MFSISGYLRCIILKKKTKRRKVKLYEHENARWPHHRAPRAACLAVLLCTEVNMTLSTPRRRGEVGVLGKLLLAVALDGVSCQNPSLANLPPGTYRVRGRLGPRVGLALERRQKVVLLPTIKPRFLGCPGHILMHLGSYI